MAGVAWDCVADSPTPSATLRGGRVQTTNLERQDDLRNAPEQRHEPHPDQDQRGPRREELLRGPEAKDQLEDPGQQTEPPQLVDVLGHGRRDDVQGALQDQQETKVRRQRPERVVGCRERRDRADQEDDSQDDVAPPPGPANGPDHEPVQATRINTTPSRPPTVPIDVVSNRRTMSAMITQAIPVIRNNHQMPVISPNIPPNLDCAGARRLISGPPSPKVPGHHPTLPGRQHVAAPRRGSFVFPYWTNVGLARGNTSRSGRCEDDSSRTSSGVTRSRPGHAARWRPSSRGLARRHEVRCRSRTPSRRARALRAPE